jgi:hypothetical protein
MPAGASKKLSLGRTQGTKAIKRLCSNPSTLVALLHGDCVKLKAKNNGKKERQF